MDSLVGIIILLVLVGMVATTCARIVKQYQRGVLFRLGKLVGTLEPGLNFILPWIDKLQIVDMRMITSNVMEQESITTDNVPLKLSTVVWYKIKDPAAAVLKIADVDDAVVQVALTVLRNVIGQHKMDEVLQRQDQMAEQAKKEMDTVTEDWGVEIARVQVKNIEIPEGIQRAMAQEAEALRGKRARVIKAEGELEASRTMAEAADVIAHNPIALELRRLQMVTDVGAENNSTTVFMLPSEIFHMAGSIGKIAEAFSKREKGDMGAGEKKE